MCEIMTILNEKKESSTTSHSKFKMNGKVKGSRGW